MKERVFLCTFEIIARHVSFPLYEKGDFYITRHSTLSEVHAMFHLVIDPDATKVESLVKSVNPERADVSSSFPLSF